MELIIGCAVVWAVFSVGFAAVLDNEFRKCVPRNPLLVEYVRDLCVKEPNGWHDTGTAFYHDNGFSLNACC